MSATHRETVIGVLLLITWTLSSFGAAQQNWALCVSAIPSLSLALILHVAGMSQRNRAALHNIEQVRSTGR